MEDCCAVCAEPLEWVAYGSCGHRDVCSTCVIRIRVVLGDKRCCICKQECDSVFVTKALGDFTKIIQDFGSLSRHMVNGKVNGEFWYDNDSGAYFDDEDQYAKSKAMCRLHCRVCEDATDDVNLPSGSVRKGHIFPRLNILGRHLADVHALYMCKLCLAGRKVFLCDQKLYTRAQLERHKSKGDPKVDGADDGFAGHPMCAFCTRRFYDNNDLYMHMSTEHFTCHICQRSRPGQFDYYQNYDDLEAHFRSDHMLCEHPDCLSKKFVVFASEQEFRIHTAKDHGGNLSKAERQAALKIPVTIRVRRTTEESSAQRRRNGDTSHAAAIRESIDTAQVETSLHNMAVSSSNSVVEPEDPFPALRPTEGTSSMQAGLDASRYREAVHGMVSSSLGDSAFPPLPGVPEPSEPSSHRLKQKKKAGKPSMAEILGGKVGKAGKIKILNAGNAGLSLNRLPSPSPNVVANGGPLSSSIIQQSPPRSVGHVNHMDASLDSSAPELSRKPTGRGAFYSAVAGIGPPPDGPREVSGGGSRNSVPVSMMSEANKLNMEEIRAATKLLAEQIKRRLNDDEGKFAQFKDFQTDFRKGNMSSEEYVDSIAQMGLGDIIPELARLCPDQERQRELLKAYSVKVVFPALAPLNKPSSAPPQAQSSNPRAKSPHMDAAGISANMEEILSDGGYRRTKGKLVPLDGSSWACQACTLINEAERKACVACGAKANAVNAAPKKKPAKVSKFQRMRLGGTSAQEDSIEDSVDSTSSTSSRGVWGNGGGQRLRATLQK